MRSIQHVERHLRRSSETNALTFARFKFNDGALKRLVEELKKNRGDYIRSTVTRLRLDMIWGQKKFGY